ncbi:nucleotide exchange factor GrpE [Ornithinibacillus sp. 4-3]|uniref:Protein GrpE n=1 Tax=Ornithinibacillus sp. 4-3 TaxID=3231488 RepID=A0AB39HL72_9BACI
MEEKNKENIASEEVDEVILEQETEEVDEDAEVTIIEESQPEQAELEKLRTEQEETLNRYLRLQAEYDNFKKRTQKERVAERKYKSQDLASDLLPVLDNFERALQVETNESNQGIIEGIQMVYNQLTEALASHGIQQIETIGQPFDPNLHHAIMQVEDEEKESNEILEELQKGYLIHDRVIRPAMVKVNK